ncbi:MAG: ROK family protein, partial [Ruthenibacterium sp.]
MKKFTIGVDLGGTNIAAGLVDDNDIIVDKLSCKTNLPQPEAGIEQMIATLCKEIAQKNNVDFDTQIEWVGIG